MGARQVVLIADDEELFLKSVVDGFARHADKVRVLTAPNGRVAAQIVEKERVDLVVTDLKMPEMDGFQLIAHLSRVRPELPVIVMTAFGTAEIEGALSRQGVAQYLDKPLDFAQLADRVFEVLAARASGHLEGIALPTLLQMIELDRKTCTLRVATKARSGLLHFRRGELVGAQRGDRTGVEAAYSLVTLPRPGIDLLPLQAGAFEPLGLTVNELLLEAFRREDEEGRARAREQRLRNEVTPAPGMPPARDTETPAVGDDEQQDASEASSQQEEEDMSAQEKLKELASVEGFIGAAVYTPSGELLAITNSEAKNLKDVGVLANTVLMNAQKASLDMGTGRGQQVHIEAERAHIIVRCLNEGSDPLRSQPGKAHIHMMVALSSDMSIGLAKMRVNSVIQKLADDFRS